MQTFLPLPDLRESARCLDTQRLRKQRIEVLQILKTLNSPPEENRGWRNHPAVLMWDGYTEALVDYGLHCCESYAVRGFPDNGMANQILDFSFGNESVLPHWFGDDRFHSTHRAALLRKGLEDETFRRFKASPLRYNLWAFPLLKREWTPETYQRFWDEYGTPESHHYSQFGWTEEPAKPNAKGSLPYYWPTKEKTNA